VDAGLDRRIREAAALLIRRGATAVYVFGSATTGRLRDDSDVDMAVEGLPASVFFKAMAEASRIVGQPVDLVALDRGDGIGEALRRSGGLARVA
jgi:predicted nucleotidyltransferase